MSKYLTLLTILCLSLFSHVGSIYAQNYSAAYTVNDSVITHYDIDQRVKMLRALGVQASNMREVATQQLIDDRLRAEAAQRMGMNISDEALSNGLESFARAANITSEQLWARARSQGVSREAFEEYYTVQLAWRQIVQARFRTFSDPTSVDIDNAVTTIKAPSQQSILLAEIALPFAERGEEATLALAARLSRELNSGVDFDTAVKNFSRSPTAQKGGEIGWIPTDRLPAPIAAKVLGLATGRVSEPVRVASGVLLLKVKSRRTISAPISKLVTVRYGVLDLSGQVDALNMAYGMQGNIDECNDTTTQANAFGGASGIVGPTNVNDVPADIAIALARILPGETTVVANGESVKLLQLCNRESTIENDTNDIIRNNVFGQKMSNYAEGFLLELRRNALIEKK